VGACFSTFFSHFEFADRIGQTIIVAMISSSFFLSFSQLGCWKSTSNPAVANILHGGVGQVRQRLRTLGSHVCGSFDMNEQGFWMRVQPRTGNLGSGIRRLSGLAPLILDLEGPFSQAAGL